MSSAAAVFHRLSLAGKNGAMQNFFDIKGLASPTTLNADTLFGQVAQLLGRAIVSGEYKAGDLLPNEQNLKADISVSRTAYREAVKILTAKGMVEARPKSGTRVAPRENWNLIDPDVLIWQLSMNPSESFIRELFELRRIIEPRAAQLAAQRRTSQQLAALDEAMTAMETERPYSELSIRADLDFHRALFVSAGNPALACLAHVVVATIQWTMLLQSTRNSESFIGPAWDHRRVRNAIADQNGELAAAMMEVLIIESLDNTLTEFGKKIDEKRIIKSY
jgi:GntR family transcriptional regulator, galactonate operon transcriptional repressor